MAARPVVETSSDAAAAEPEQRERVLPLPTAVEMLALAKLGQFEDFIRFANADVELAVAACQLQSSKQRFTALHMAAHFGHEAAARLIVRFGGLIDRRSSTGLTPIDSARRAGHNALAGALEAAFIAEEAYRAVVLSLTGRDRRETRVLPSSNRFGEAHKRISRFSFFASHSRSLVQISEGDSLFVDSWGRALIGTDGSFSPPRDVRGRPLVDEEQLAVLDADSLYAAARRGKFDEMLRSFAHPGVASTCCAFVASRSGWTLLHQAVAHNNIVAAKLLLMSGARPDAAALDGLTPLQIAQDSRFDELATILRLWPTVTSSPAETAAAAAPSSADLALVSPSAKLGECVVCIDAPRRIVLAGCGHLCLCEQCAELVSACPVCRKPCYASDMIRIFIP